MKKFFVLLFALFALSCSMDDGNDVDFVVEFVPVESVDVPESVTPGQTYPFTLYYRRPSDCYYVEDDFYYEPDGNVRTVAIQALVIEDAQCLPVTTEAPESTSFNFQCPLQAGVTEYIFKFYTGEDANGNLLFMEKVVPVGQ